eukprot:966691-Rhodomonas_salina.2
MGRSTDLRVDVPGTVARACRGTAEDTQAGGWCREEEGKRGRLPRMPPRKRCLCHCQCEKNVSPSRGHVGMPTRLPGVTVGPG